MVDAHQRPKFKSKIIKLLEENMKYIHRHIGYQNS